MTGIPDEVVERCAEVLVNSIRGNHGLGPVPLSDVGDPEVYRHHVRVVLAGCYWLEMREALEKIAIARPDSEPPFRCMGEGLMAARVMRDIARAALTIKRETGT